MYEFTFRLPQNFLDKYRELEPKWGFTDAGGNSVGELTFIRTYSRIKEDGSKERWVDSCERIINGMYSIQKDWCKEKHLPWNDRKAQASAQEAFDMLFYFKWTPAGRGIAQMGTPLVMDTKNSASLYNCSFISTASLDRNDPGALFGQFMAELMYGIGVGFDTLAADREIPIHVPSGDVQDFVVGDSREGWADSIRVLINSFLKPNGHKLIFDYSEVRPYGSPLKTFGGTASGPDPLRRIHNRISELFMRKAGQTLDSELIVDIMNLIGTAVVAGSSRRSAELALGDPKDDVFINLKNHERYPERNAWSEDDDEKGWGFMSNNSLSVTVGADYAPFVDRIVSNGEPGFVWLDVIRTRGRMADGFDDADASVRGVNPCGEIPLDSFEKCNLSEIHINRIDDIHEFKRAIKFAYLYSKTVCLLSTPWEQVNAVLKANNRIGLSVTGIAGWLDDHKLYEYRDYSNQGYEVVSELDKSYSRWLCIRESIRKTTSKPSGSISLLSGATPGGHWSPGGEYYLRAIRFGDSDPALKQFEKAGYRIENDLSSSNTKVVYFPIKGASKRSEKDVSIFEKIHLASEIQHYWSDNAVSVTVSFDKETESKYVEQVLNMYEGRLKSVSFLPMGNETYPQQPYTQITEQEYNDWMKKLKPVNTSVLYKDKKDATVEKFCDTDVCQI